MKRQIYLLYSCNAWKEHSSMSLVMASTSEKTIRKEIKRQVKSKDMEYGADKKDLDVRELSFINNCLEYGHIDIVGNGEKQ